MKLDWGFPGIPWDIRHYPNYPPDTCAMVKSRYIGDGHPTFNRNLYNRYINPYYWIDDHPLLYGNNGSLGPGTHHLLPFTGSHGRFPLCEDPTHQNLGFPFEKMVLSPGKYPFPVVFSRTADTLSGIKKTNPSLANCNKAFCLPTLEVFLASSMESFIR